MVVVVVVVLVVNGIEVLVAIALVAKWTILQFHWFFQWRYLLVPE